VAQTRWSGYRTRSRRISRHSGSRLPGALNYSCKTILQENWSDLTLIDTHGIDGGRRCDEQRRRPAYSRRAVQPGSMKPSSAGPAAADAGGRGTRPGEPRSDPGAAAAGRTTWSRENGVLVRTRRSRGWASRLRSRPNSALAQYRSIASTHRRMTGGSTQLRLQAYPRSPAVAARHRRRRSFRGAQALLKTMNGPRPARRCRPQLWTANLARKQCRAEHNGTCATASSRRSRPPSADGHAAIVRRGLVVGRPALKLRWSRRTPARHNSSGKDRS